MISLILLCSIVGVLYFIYRWQIHRHKYGVLVETFPDCSNEFLRWRGELLNPDNGLRIIQRLSKIPKYKQHALISSYFMKKLIVFDPKLTELILNTNVNKTYEYGLVKSWLKTGILTSRYEKWKMQKRLLAPAFHMQNLQHYMHVFNEQAAVLCDKLEVQLTASTVDIQQHVVLCTLDVILSTTIGANIKTQHNPANDYLRSIQTMCDVLYRRSFEIFLSRNLYYRFTSLQRAEIQASKCLNDFSLQFIHDRRGEKTSSAHPTILDILLDTQGMSDEDIVAELNTFIFAGHDTTGNTISFALYALSKNAAVQQKVYQEIVDVVGNENAPSYNDLENLTYTSMVLKEVSRLYPAVPLISRYLTKEIFWNGCLLPKGLEVYFANFVIHRNEDIFPDPEKFDPERFNTENAKKIPPGAYMPFGLGPRNCIGQKFAQLEMKAVLVRLLRRFEILPAPNESDLHLIAMVTLQSKNGIKIRLNRR